MKKIFTLLMFLNITCNVFAQDISYKITEVKVNGNPIAYNAPIEFGTNSSVTVRFKVTFTKPDYLTIGSVSHVIGTQSPSGFIQLITPESFSLNSGNTGFTGLWEKVIYASDYSASGENYLVSKLTQTSGTPPLNWESNRVPIIKEPTFTLSPTTVSLACGSTSPRTFTVTPANIPSGANVTYQWSFSGWNGPNSTSSSISLSPASGTILPSTVTVTPFINGVAKPSKSCTITRAAFNPTTSEITGNVSFCPGSSSSYTISNLGTNTVTWSVSNPAVASLSATSGATVTVTGLSNGTVTLNAIITNACGQTATKSKTFNIGSPNFPSGMTGEPNPVSGQYKTYSVPQATGAVSYYWYFDAGGVLGTNINGWQISNGQGATSITAKVGNPGATIVVCRATNVCGNSIKYIYVNARSVSDPCDGFKISITNPVKKGDNLVGRVIPPPVDDPCDNIRQMLSQKEEKKEVKLYDLFGRLVFSDFFISDEFQINNLNLPKGNYILNITLSNGKTQKQIVVVE